MTHNSRSQTWRSEATFFWSGSTLWWSRSAKCKCTASRNSRLGIYPWCIQIRQMRSLHNWTSKYHEAAKRALFLRILWGFQSCLRTSAWFHPAFAWAFSSSQKPYRPPCSYTYSLALWAVKQSRTLCQLPCCQQSYAYAPTPGNSAPSHRCLRTKAFHCWLIVSALILGSSPPSRKRCLGSSQLHGRLTDLRLHLTESFLDPTSSTTTFISVASASTGSYLHSFR